MTFAIVSRHFRMTIILLIEEKIGPEVKKHFFMLNSTEHEILMLMKAKC